MKRLKLTVLLAISLYVAFSLAAQPALAADSDFNNDGKDEAVAMYDYPASCSALWVMKDTGTNTAWWASAYGAWDATKSKVVSGVFTADNFDDVAILQGYPGNCGALWLFASNGSNKFTPTPVWASAYGNFQWDNAKIVAGDFDGDTRSEILMLYTYPGNCAAIWIFDDSGSGWTMSAVWASAPGNFIASGYEISAGDFDDDGTDELAMLHPYPNSCAAIWVFDKKVTNKWEEKVWWASGYGQWNVANSKMVAGDFSGDGTDDLAALYDYPNACAAAWQFTSDTNKFTAAPVWSSAYGAWDVKNSKVAAGLANADSFADLFVMQEYPASCSALWLLRSSGSAMTSNAIWASGYGGWNTKKSRLANGSTFLPTSYGLGDKKIDINLSTQTLTCGETLYGEFTEGVYSYSIQPAFTTLVSSGRSPFDTPTGNFSVYAKDATTDMSGFGGTSEYYYVPNVPYVLWFNGNYSIHGAYWHNDFGNVRSHGCVNVPVDAGAWIYNWAPVGTPVNVHY